MQELWCVGWGYEDHLGTPPRQMCGKAWSSCANSAVSQWFPRRRHHHQPLRPAKMFFFSHEEVLQVGAQTMTRKRTTLKWNLNAIDGLFRFPIIPCHDLVSPRQLYTCRDFFCTLYNFTNCFWGMQVTCLSRPYIATWRSRIVCVIHRWDSNHFSPKRWPIY